MSISRFDVPQSGAIYTGSSLADAQRNYANAQRMGYEQICTNRHCNNRLLGGSASMIGMAAHPPMPLTEAELTAQKARKREQTWERRVDTLIEAQKIRRVARAFSVLWAFCWIWGSMIAVAITIGLFSFLIRLTLG